MAGNKHPRIFGERGSVSWGELWDHLGPLADQVFSGVSVAKEDGKWIPLKKVTDLTRRRLALLQPLNGSQTS